MIKLALFTVTYCGLWYKGPALSLEDQIVKARELGFDGLAVETKRPVALPCDLNQKRRSKVKELAESYQVKLCAVETMSNFVSPIIEERENNLCMVKEAIELAKDLEAPIVKVFAAWAGTSRYDGLGTYEFSHRLFDYKRNFVTMDKMWRWAVEGIRDVARWAEEYGIVVALQNHPPVISYGYEDALQMVKEVAMDNVKLCLDVPLFIDQSDEYIHEAVEACKEVGIVHSHYGSHAFGLDEDGVITIKRGRYRWMKAERVNYPAFIRELKRIGYDGFIASEECAPVLENHIPQGIDIVDRRVKAALRYMKTLIETGAEPEIRLV